MSDFWFPWYPALYRLKTLHLTAEQDGIYRRLIDHYMESAQPLPENITALCRIAGCDLDAIRMPLAFFTHSDGIGYTHKTCDSILAEMHERHVRRHGAAKAGANARWKNINKIQHEKCDSDANSNAVAMRPDATLTLTPKGRKVSISPIVPFLLFDECWTFYPKSRRGGEDNARKAYAKALARGNSEEKILAGVQAYALSTEARDFPKGFAAWLNDDRFNNDYSHRGIKNDKSSNYKTQALALARKYQSQSEGEF